jgi:hypothetical protein
MESIGKEERRKKKEEGRKKNDGRKKKPRSFAGCGFVANRANAVKTVKVTLS